MHFRPARTSSFPTSRRRVIGRLVALAVALVVLVPAAASAVPIEDFATYDPQTNCSPNAKPGTLKLSAWLQNQYPGSGSLGISRSCNDGGVSEHKEGRAFDWAVNVRSARDRAFVTDFFAKIFATDAEGNPDALARRMGIMYLIWNDHIYSSYYGFQARDYKGCKVLSSCSDTLRHRNHVHISLSRAGGNGLTSWYTGGTAVPPAGTATGTTAPVVAPSVPLVPKTSTGILDLRKRPFVTVTVSPKGAVKTTGFKLRKGYAYKVTAAGLYGYGTPTQVADASCRWSPGARGWAPYPANDVARTHGSLNLLVNGKPISAKTCRTTHAYAMTVKPKVTGPLKLQVANKPTGATGSLWVLVSRSTTNVTSGLPAVPTLAAAPTTTGPQDGTGLVSETVAVPAASGTVLTSGALEQGAEYRLTVDGSADLGKGVATDGRCLSVAGTWWSQASLERTVPDQAHGRLYVDGVAFAGDATNSGSVCVSRSHTSTYTATRSGRLELALWDPLARSDDAGQVTVTVQRLTSIGTPEPAPAETPAATTPWTQRSETVTVSTAAPTGTVSTMRVRVGQRVTMTARGTYKSGSTDADGSCVATGTGWVTSDPSVLLPQEPLELWADGQRVPWRPVSGTTACAGDHAYTASFTATKNGPLRFAVLDLDHRDNTGTLTVTLTRAS
jgi:hypothetical protein